MIALREVFERIELDRSYRPYRAVYALPEEIDWERVDSYESYPEGYLK